MDPPGRDTDYVERRATTIFGGCRRVGLAFALAVLVLAAERLILLGRGVGLEEEWEATRAMHTATAVGAAGVARYGEAAQGMERVVEEPVAPLPPDGKYRLLVMSSCSGSTFVTATVKKILSAHGYDVVEWKFPWVQELGRPQGNPYFKRVKELAPPGTSELEIIGNATVMYHQQQFDRGKTLLFKWGEYIFDHFADGVGRENVLFGGVVRENVLDLLICHIRDCFGTGTPQPLGYPVFAANGSKADLCFGRRNAGEGGRTKAYIHPQASGGLVEYLHGRARHVKTFKAQFGPITSESLLAFEYTDDRRTFAASMAAWCLLAGRFVGSSLDCGIVEDMFRPHISSRSISYHEDVIDNFEEVFETLRGAGLGGYIRSIDGHVQGDLAPGP